MLFENITDLKSVDVDLLEREFDTYRSYMRGKSKITKLAKSINAYIETTSFAVYIDRHPEGVILSIAKTFRDILPDIDIETGNNVGDELASLFEAIILEASKNATTPKIDESEDKELTKTISYNKLWKLLIDKGWNKQKLQEESNVSAASIAKLGRGGNITTDVLLKICEALDCDLEDIMETIHITHKLN